MTRLRAIARGTAYAGGLLGAGHWLHHRDTLAVVMFHRITALGGAAAAAADPDYSLSAPLFTACLLFFQRHYNVVGLGQLRESLRGGRRLPPCSLLITFDDGWQDNVSVALPILQRLGLPAAVFVAADVLAATTPWWWQEVLLRALRTGRVTPDRLWALAGGEPQQKGDNPELALLVRYCALGEQVRRDLLETFALDTAAEGRHMLRPDGLRQLAAAGIDLGAHGAAHLPLTMVRQPEADLARARAVLEPHLGSLGQPLDTLSFPHGRYDAASLAAARAAGFVITLTSDPCLNAAPGGRPAALLGRIPIDAAAVTDCAGSFAPSRLATWLFHRPVAALAG